MKKYVVGNWKMNQSLAEIESFFATLKKSRDNYSCEMWVAPQFIHISYVTNLIKTLPVNLPLQVGAQNSSQWEKGAYTGEVSPLALREVGATFTIIGHSERRQYFHEGHSVLRDKLQQALKSGIKVIFCVGETLDEREKGQAHAIVEEQVREGLRDLPLDQLQGRLLVAYEPVWAIGTGKTATADQAQEMHGLIRGLLKNLFGQAGAEFPLLYGGSVKPANIAELVSRADIDGALVGGASLKGEDFLAMCQETTKAAGNS